MNSSFWTNFILLLVIFHFIVGFSYLVYKLSPKKDDKKARREQIVMIEKDKSK
ncbi:MAG: hypothetical protein ACI8VT_003884 [Saprospiraceae bacterium]|jgi:hypothetical protein